MKTDRDALVDDCFSLMRKHVDVIKALQKATNRLLTDDESEAIARYMRVLAVVKNSERKQRITDDQIAKLLASLPPDVRERITITED